MAESTSGSELPSENGENQLHSIISNMALAHEIIINENFELTSLPEQSFERQIKNIVHQAFWDILEEEVNQEQPSYDQAIKLLMEIKQILIDSLIPVSKEQLKQQVDEVMDSALIHQQVSAGAFDLPACTEFIVSVMEKLCAPARDEDVARLRNLDGVTNTLRGIFGVLDLMKLDMANYQLQSLKPIIIRQSVEYELTKFKQILDRNPDGLQKTTAWLSSALRAVQLLRQQGTSPRQLSPAVVVTHAHLSLLDAPVQERLCPETLLLDCVRLGEMAQTFRQLSLIGTLLVISANALGEHLSSDAAFMQSLKDDFVVLLKDVNNDSKLSETLPGIYEQVLSCAEKALLAKELAPLSSEAIESIRLQIVDVSNEKNYVRKLITSRIREHVLLSMTSSASNVPVAAALRSIAIELKEHTGRFSRLIEHNLRVYHKFYVDIVNSLISEETDSTPGKAVTGEEPQEEGSQTVTEAES